MIGYGTGFRRRAAGQTEPQALISWPAVYWVYNTKNAAVEMLRNIRNYN
jgi:hypothetical protein